MPYCPRHDYEWEWGKAPDCPQCLAENEAAEPARYGRREILISISGLITAIVTRKPRRGGRTNG